MSGATLVGVDGKALASDASVAFTAALENWENGNATSKEELLTLAKKLRGDAVLQSISLLLEMLAKIESDSQRKQQLKILAQQSILN